MVWWLYCLWIAPPSCCNNNIVRPWLQYQLCWQEPIASSYLFSSWAIKFSHFTGSGTSLLFTGLLVATVFSLAISGYRSWWTSQSTCQTWHQSSWTENHSEEQLQQKGPQDPPKVLAVLGFPIATTSACPSMIRIGSSPRSVASRWSGQETPVVNTSARTAFDPVRSCPLTSAKARGTAYSSRVRMLLRLTCLPASYAEMRLCRMFQSAFTVIVLPLRASDFWTTNNEENVKYLFFGRVSLKTSFLSSHGSLSSMNSSSWSCLCLQPTTGHLEFLEWLGRCLRCFAVSGVRYLRIDETSAEQTAEHLLLSNQSSFCLWWSHCGCCYHQIRYQRKASFPEQGKTAHLLSADVVFVMPMMPPPFLPTPLSHSWAWSGDTWLKWCEERLTTKQPASNSYLTATGSWYISLRYRHCTDTLYDVATTLWRHIGVIK